MTTRAALLRASILAVAAPLAACGGDTSDGASPGSGGGAQGGNAGASQGGGAQGGTSATSKFTCDDPVAVLVDGKDTGYDTCAAGQTRRREAKACPSALPRAAACNSGGGADSCKTDSECNDKPNGYCAAASGNQAPGCSCAYGCTTDADCGADAICLCGAPVGRCVPAKCKDDAGCPEGDCTSYDSSPGCAFIAFACQSTADTCGGDKDCAGSGGTMCAYGSGAAGAAAKSCHPAGCAIGRPLLVGEVARAAALFSRTDWA